MDTFGFTKKKILSLSEKNRHRHIIDWLSAFYQKLAANRIKKTVFDDFCSRYETILKWTNLPLPLRPDQGTRPQIEYISNAIQSHRLASGITLRDDTLLEPTTFQDRTTSTIQLPDMEYQVALDGLRSLFNVGSIFRTCDATGVRTLILGNTLGKEHPQVQKTAMGAQEWVPQEKTSDLAKTLVTKKEQGFRIIGMETVPGSIPCHKFAWPSKCVVVFGNEEYGISSHVMPVLDDIVHIPMFGKKNSLNVANAMATVLFQAIFALSLQH
ncbi:MAG: RNA methyltransferase [Desulfobacteraceae bacterium]|nr:RNA methyltransferase [Desulfobacteraceae bacterium]